MYHIYIWYKFITKIQYNKKFLKLRIHYMLKQSNNCGFIRSFWSSLLSLIYLNSNTHVTDLCIAKTSFRTPFRGDVISCALVRSRFSEMENTFSWWCHWLFVLVWNRFCEMENTFSLWCHSLWFWFEAASVKWKTPFFLFILRMAIKRIYLDRVEIVYCRDRIYLFRFL